MPLGSNEQIYVDVELNIMRKSYMRFENRV